MSSSEENSSPSFEDHLVSVVPGLNGLQLWPYLNTIMISWALLAFVPRWKWTPSLSLVVPLLVCVVYTSGMIRMMMENNAEKEDVDLFSYHGVVTAFKDPNIVFIGWIHYIAFDCIIGRMIVMDSVNLGASLTFHVLAMFPCLFLTLMLGPIGFLLYAILRRIFLSPTLSIGEYSSQQKEKVH